MKKHLKSLGFKKKWLDDHSGYWWEKKCLNPWFPKLKIQIEEFKGEYSISLECADPDDENGDKKWAVTIYRNTYTKERLRQILEYFDIGWEVQEGETMHCGCIYPK